MKQIIVDWNLELEDTKAWIHASYQWRMPYWDWARKQRYCDDFALPHVLTQAQVPIYPPKHLIKDLYPAANSYPNPLWGFDNPETDKHGNPLPFGSMPPGKEMYNIKNDPADITEPDPTNRGLQPVSPKTLPTAFL